MTLISTTFPKRVEKVDGKLGNGPPGTSLLITSWIHPIHPIHLNIIFIVILHEVIGLKRHIAAKKN